MKNFEEKGFLTQNGLSMLVFQAAKNHLGYGLV